MPKFVLEQGLLDYTLVSLKPSLMAAVAWHLALLVTERGEVSNVSSVWNLNLQHYSVYSSNKLMPTVKKVASMLINAENTKLQAVRSKYSTAKFMKVALLPQMKGKMIIRLAQA